jgi:hypothetical protein
MPSIFGSNSETTYGGAFRTVNKDKGGTGVTFGGIAGGVSLIQNLQVSHQQPVQNLFEVGSNKRYYVIGKSSGTFSISQILGFGPTVLSNVTALADPCSVPGGRVLTISFPNSYCSGAEAANGVGGSLTLTLKGVLLQSMGFSTQAQDNLISTQVQGVMTELEYITVPA